MSALTVLRVSGEEVNANISEALDVSQLYAMVAAALDTFTPCLSLLHDCAPLPKEMLVKDIGAGASILAVVNADMHDLCVELRALDTRRSGLRRKAADQEKHLEQMMYRLSKSEEQIYLGCLKWISLWQAESDLEKADLAGCLTWKRRRLPEHGSPPANTWSLPEEKQIIAQIGKLKQERRHLEYLTAGADLVHDELCEALRNCRCQLQDQNEDFHHQWGRQGWEEGKSFQRALTVRDAIFLHDPELRYGLECLGLSEEMWDALDPYPAYDNDSSGSRYPDEYEEYEEDPDEDEEYGEDMKEHQREKHARHRHGCSTRKAFASVARSLYPGKVRLRGGRHKVGEQVDLTLDVI